MGYTVDEKKGLMMEEKDQKVILPNLPGFKPYDFKEVCSRGRFHHQVVSEPSQEAGVRLS
jgi:hypothetical protein